MRTENEIRDQLQIAISKRDSEQPMELDEWAHIEGYILALGVVLNQAKPKFNKEDI